MSLEPGKGLLHYRIDRLIGQGGMGQVFLAEDTRLRRKVALKLLPAATASHADRLARFRREAQTLAALNHPHIVTIYSVEEAEGTHFLTMELVEGTSLDDLVSPGGLAMEKVFDVGIALADALAAAHEQGIIHRDLKPANVMITKDGRVKVLDFGLAKLASGTPEGAAAPDATVTLGALAPTDPMDRSLTATGVIVGTVPYMSPEQVGGEAVDARTDIFALGVILYEMTTGRRPFQGKNSAETISSILRDTPRPLTEARQEAPRELARIIDHCLQKNPRDRFQTVRDVFNELSALRKEVETEATTRGYPPPTPTSEPPSFPGPVSQSISPVAAARGRARWRWVWAIGGVAAITSVGLILFRSIDQAPRQPATSAVPAENATEPEVRSIAVLPFVNMSEDKANEYFADGVSEELLNLLSQFPELRVSAQTSSFSFKGTAVEIPEIARKLHVAHVLEGSVRKSGDQVRITAQLIHAVDGYHVWSQTWDRKLGDIFTIQDEIAADVAQALEVSLLERSWMKTRKTEPKAYALVLQARQSGPILRAEQYARIDSLYREALEIDPRYPPALLARGWLAKSAATLGLLSVEEARIRSRDGAEKAVAVDPNYAAAHGSLGWDAMTFDNDFAGAARHYEHALALDPMSVVLLGNASTLLYCLGRPAEAMPLMKAVTRRDPVNPYWFLNLSIFQDNMGQHDSAIASLRTALNLLPNLPGAHSQLGIALLHKGDNANALAEIKSESVEVYRLMALAMAYHALGRQADSDAALASLLARFENFAYQVACIYAYRGEADQAFAWLGKAVERHDPGLLTLVMDIDLTNLHSDPRWLPFLRSIGRAPEQLEKVEFSVALPEYP